MRSMNLRHDTRKPAHVFIGLREISSSVSLDMICRSYRHAIRVGHYTLDLLIQALLLIRVESQ
jgi:hypothetical protein